MVRENGARWLALATACQRSALPISAVAATFSDEVRAGQGLRIKRLGVRVPQGALTVTLTIAARYGSSRSALFSDPL